MRLRIHICGLVQGVGFRPFVYRLAKEMHLRGYVLNSTEGVIIEVEGEEERLREFLLRVERERPRVSVIYSLQYSILEDRGYKEFTIKESNRSGIRELSILPDIATCNDCISELFDSHDRRFHYPFINCTNCGPRFTIIHDIPYDRKNTSMKTFQMCEECEHEYNDPRSRRFHAQPNACHKCGPWVSLLNSKGEIISNGGDAIDRTVSLIRNGNIIAIKGIGGYHLVCDAMNDPVVIELRRRKHREEKPMAVMFPDTMMIKMHAHVNSLEERALTSIERPIVILDKKEESNISPHVSSTETIGAFLPYSPLHHILLKKINTPIIATSANITEEPIAKDENDAMQRLSGIADYFLVHNRPIVRRCDDSVVRIMAERQIPIRRSRGYVPVPIIIPFVFKRPVLALGAHMHTTIAIGIDNKVYVSQHIGDLETPLNIEFYRETIDDFLKLFDVVPHCVITDLHPAYYSTRYGIERFRERTLSVQHHHAHIISCMAENEIPEDREVIGFAFDGIGYGTDGSIWGSEAIIASYHNMKRAYYLRPYRLPGGDRATKEPWRVGISLLYEAFGEDMGKVELPGVDQIKRDFILQMIKKGINSPYTTSMGRLFDGVASIVGLRQRVSYQAQAAIELEDLAKRADTHETYEFHLHDTYIDHRPVIQGIVSDIRSGSDIKFIARKFHNTIVQMIIVTAERLRDETGIEHVALSGGVFQNSIILEHSYNRLREQRFIPLIHQLVPPNDGGLSLGQAVYGLFKIH